MPGRTDGCRSRGGDRRRALREAAAILFALGTSGCFYSDWSLDTPSADSGPDARREASTADVTTDTAAPPPEASPILDATPDGETSTPTWCQTQGKHSLCADFDEGNAALGWTTQLLSTSGTMMLDSTFVVSPPDSLLTGLLPTGAATTTALFEKIFSSKATTWVFAFDVRIDSLNAGTSGGDFGIARIWGASQNRLTVHTDGTLVWVDVDIPTVDAGSFARQNANLQAPIGAWQRIEIDVSFSGTSHVVEVLAGAARSNVLNFTLSNSFQNGDPEFDLGLVTFGAGTMGSDTRYDDVIIDVTP
jgi:hypothetical protein